jgi:hypothetical protein
MSRLLQMALLWGLALAQPAWAEHLHSQSVGPAEHGVLAPLQERRDGLPRERQHEPRTGAERWSQENDGERDRLERWNALTPEERAGLRQRYQRFRQLPPEQQDKVRGSFDWFQSLPAERKRALVEQWRRLTPEQRQKVLPSYVPRRQDNGRRDHSTGRRGPGR